jgi:hypothetical protein
VDAVPAVACFFIGAVGLSAMYVWMAGLRSAKPNKAMEQSTILFGLLMVNLQNLSLLLMISVEWGEPVNGLLQMLQVFVFGLDLIRMGCIANFSAVAEYSFRVAIIFVCGTHLSITHFGLKLWKRSTAEKAMHSTKRHKATSKYALIDVLGGLGSIFFVSVVSTLLTPLRCIQHPNGIQTVRAVPNVICGQSDEHATMIAIAAVSLALPVFFIAACLAAVWLYPQQLNLGHRAFLQATNFLFHKVTSKSYWYMPVVYLRNALIAIATTLSNATAQIIWLQMLTMLSWLLLNYTMPYRIAMANYLDAACHLLLLMVVSLAAFYVDDVDLTIVGLSAFMFIGVILTLLIGGMLLTSGQRVRSALKKSFKYFLSHHKGGAGAMARLLKMRLEQQQGCAVWLDSDDLRDLTKLFDYVVQSESFLLLLSEGVLMRPWCWGEIVTAHLNVMPTLVACYPLCRLCDQFMKCSDAVDLSCLAAHRMDKPMVEAAKIWLAKQPTVRLHSEVISEHVATLCAEIRTRTSQVHVNVAPQKSISIRQSSDQLVLVAVDNTCMEASATALVLCDLVGPLVQHRPELLPSLLHGGEKATGTWRVRFAIVVCSPEIFKQLHVISFLRVCVQKSAAMLPVLAEDQFRFPDEDSLKSELTQWHAQRLVRFSDIEAMLAVILVLFKNIAVVFQPQSYSYSFDTLQLRAQEVFRWLEQSDSRFCDEPTLQPVTSSFGTSSFSLRPMQTETVVRVENY